MALNGNAVDCNKNQGGTGLISCLFMPKQLSSAYLVFDPLWQLSIASGTFDADYVNSKIQDGTFVPILNALEFTSNTPEPTTEELQGGIIRTVRNGKPMYMFGLDNGPLWHAKVYSYNSNPPYGILLVDKAGNVEGAQSVDGIYMKSYRLSNFNVRTRQLIQGDTTARTNIEFQIANEEEYNLLPYIISAKSIGADLNSDISGIIDVNITGTSTTAAATVKVTAGLNTMYGFDGFTTASFRVINKTDDAEIDITVTAGGTNPGEYTLTYDTAQTAADKIVIEMYDADNSLPVAVLENSGRKQFYKGSSTEITVTA